MLNIENNEMPKIQPLQVGDGKEEKRLTFYEILTKIGDRLLGAFYIKFKF